MPGRSSAGRDTEPPVRLLLSRSATSGAKNPGSWRLLDVDSRLRRRALPQAAARPAACQRGVLGLCIRRRGPGRARHWRSSPDSAPLAQVSGGGRSGSEPERCDRGRHGAPSSSSRASASRSAASTSVASRSSAAKAFIVWSRPQPPGQRSGSPACIGHRQSQPCARQCERHGSGQSSRPGR